MKTPNGILMKQARESLAGKWGIAVGTFAVYMVLNLALAGVKGVGPAVSLVVSGPFAVGLALFSLAIARNKEAKLEQIFDGFKKFGKAIGAYVLKTLIVFLWTLLFIIPGIIAGLSYSQTFFILADDETIGVRDALTKSKQMMNGYKWKYFCLELRFLGWAILCLLSLGIGFLWLFPYVQVTMAKFFDDLKSTA